MLLQSRQFILVCLHLIDLLTFVYGNRPYVSVRGFFQGLTMIDSGRLSTYRASLCSGCVCMFRSQLYCIASEETSSARRLRRRTLIGKA